MQIQPISQITATETPEIIADRTALARAVEVVSECVERKSTVPILSNLRISGHGTHTTITGTDLDMTISVDVESVADSRFDTTIPAANLKSLLKKASKSDFASFRKDDDFATVDLENSKFNLRTVDASGFPDFQAPKPVSRFAMTTADLFEALDATKDAISTEEARYYLNGVCLASERDCLAMVATDGHRLARKQLLVPEGLDLNTMPRIIIPNKAVKILHKLLKAKDAPEMVSVEFDDCRIKLRFGSVTFMSKVIDGEFPDYHRVIPEWNERTATIDSATLLQCVSDASLVSSERGRAAKLSFGEKDVTVSSNNPDIGSSEARASSRNVDLDEFEIGFNRTYLTAVVKWICPTGGNLSMEFSDNGSAVRFVGSRGDFDAVLMPMRV
ncbi:MAG: DNA polymerase III subunit beta [Pseudomonadota bacterium]